MAKDKNQNLIVGFPHYLPINTEDGYHSLYNLVKEVNPDVLILDPLINHSTVTLWVIKGGNHTFVLIQ